MRNALLGSSFGISDISLGLIQCNYAGSSLIYTDYVPSYLFWAKKHVSFIEEGDIYEHMH